MSDAWETLVAVSDGTDAWDRLINITGGTGGSVAGTAVNEIPFKLSGVTTLTASLASSELKATTNVSNISATINVHETSATVTPEKITIMESC